MISIYNIRKNTLGGDTLQVDLRGLSTDTIPTSLTDGAIENGSSFIAIDTGDVYFYDGENEEWINVTTPADEEPAEETPNNDAKEMR